MHPSVIYVSDWRSATPSKGAPPSKHAPPSKRAPPSVAGRQQPHHGRERVRSRPRGVGQSGRGIRPVPRAPPVARTRRRRGGSPNRVASREAHPRRLCTSGGRVTQSKRHPPRGATAPDNRRAPPQGTAKAAAAPPMALRVERAGDARAPRGSDSHRRRSRGRAGQTQPRRQNKVAATAGDTRPTPPSIGIHAHLSRMRRSPVPTPTCAPKRSQPQTPTPPQ